MGIAETGLLERYRFDPLSMKAVVVDYRKGHRSQAAESAKKSEKVIGDVIRLRAVLPGPIAGSSHCEMERRLPANQEVDRHRFDGAALKINLDLPKVGPILAAPTRIENLGINKAVLVGLREPLLEFCSHLRIRPAGLFIPSMAHPLVDKIAGTKRDGVDAFEIVVGEPVMTNLFSVPALKLGD